MSQYFIRYIHQSAVSYPYVLHKVFIITVDYNKIITFPQFFCNKYNKKISTLSSIAVTELNDRQPFITDAVSRPGNWQSLLIRIGSILPLRVPPITF